MNHLIQVVDALPDYKVQRALEMIQQRHDWWLDSTVYNKNEEFIVDKEVRSNSSIALNDEDKLAKLIHHGFNKALTEYRIRLSLLNGCYDAWPMLGVEDVDVTREEIQLLRYEVGQQYLWHTDQFPNRDHKLHNRCISGVLYLNNDFEGGRTCFPHQCYKPKPGQALIFPSNWCFPHCAQEVKEGVKIAAVAWFHARSWE